MLNLMHRRIRSELQNERGSVIMAILAVMIGTFAVIAVGNAVNGGLSTVRTDQNRINAFQHANAGIDLALYRIDRGDFDGGSFQPITNGFRDTITVDGSTFVVEAVRVNPGFDHTWTVRSVGTDPSGRKRLAIATIGTNRLFNHGFFTIQDFSLTGNQVTPVAYDSGVAGCEDPTINEAACEIDPIPGRLGTNAEFVGANETIEDFVERWDGFDMYGRATQEAADEACGRGRCGTDPVVRAISNQMPAVLPEKPAGILPCPFGGIVVNQTLTPGDYLCSSLNLEGVVTVGTGGNGRVRIWVDGAFSAADDTVVNKGKPTPNLQIFQAETEDGGAYNGSICGAEIWALLYAPGLIIDCNGSHQPVIFGAVVAQLHGGTGAHFDFHWDIASIDETFDERFVVENWRECPVTGGDC